MKIRGTLPSTANQQTAGRPNGEVLHGHSPGLNRPETAPKENDSEKRFRLRESKEIHVREEKNIWKMMEDGCESME